MSTPRPNVKDDPRIEILLGELRWGHANAIPRPALSRKLGTTDRHIRRLVEAARAQGALICNDQDGRGYFLAETDEEVLRQYRQDDARVKATCVRRAPFHRYLKERGLLPLKGEENG